MIIFRTFPVRLLGYGFAVGEAMRYGFSEEASDLVYSVGVGFVFGHVLCSVMTSAGLLASVVSGLQTFCYEGLASCLIPTACNYYLCRQVSSGLDECESLSPTIKRWVPFLVGVGMVPFYMTFVDPFADWLVYSLFAPINVVA